MPGLCLPESQVTFPKLGQMGQDSSRTIADRKVGIWSDRRIPIADVDRGVDSMDR